MFAPLPLPRIEDLDVYEDDGALYSTIVPVGRCNATGRIVSVKCELAYTVNPSVVPASSWFHEFSFSILVSDPTGCHETFETQDRDLARNYVPAERIPDVMAIVHACLEKLIGRVRPLIVYRVTKAIRPNDKALKKHNSLTDVLHRNGYRLHQDGRDPFGRQFWLMTRDH